MRWKTLTQERYQFLHDCVESSIKVGMHTLGPKQAVGTALGLKKLYVLNLQKEPFKMTIDTMFRLLQSFGGLKVFKDTYLMYLRDLEKGVESDRIGSNTKYMNVRHHMSVLASDFNPNGEVFKFPSHKNFSEKEKKKALNGKYTSFISSYEGAVERRVTLHDIMSRVREIGVSYNITHQNVSESLPMEHPPSYVSLMRMYRSSGLGLEGVAPEIAPSDHDQTKSSADAFLATLQIVPILVLAQQLEARFLNAS